jgi:hypothetical protein
MAYTGQTYPFTEEDPSLLAGRILSQIKGEHNLFSSDADTGKTRYLEELHSQLKIKSTSSNWICKIDLSEISGLVNNSSNSGNLDAVHFVCREIFSLDLASLDAEEGEQRIKALSDNLVAANIDGNVFILLDSFDKVCAEHRQEATSLIELLDGIGANLVIATRPSEEQTVRNSLPTINVHCVKPGKKARPSSTTPFQ